MKYTMMKRFARSVAGLLLAVSLASCGGGGGDSGCNTYEGCDGTTVPPVTATSIELLSDVAQFSTGSTDPVTITAVVKTSGNVVLPQAAVSFETDAGNLTVLSSTTNSSGVASATLRLGSTVADKQNRTISVVARSGNVSQTLQIPVIGTSLAYSGPTSLSVGVTPVPMSVIVTDSKGQPIAGATVNVSASVIGNGLSNRAPVTNGSGIATFSYTPSNGGTDTLTLSGMGAQSVTVNLAVSGEDFVFTTPASNSTVNVGQSQTLTVRFRQSGAPVSGVTVAFAATAGTLTSSSGVTNGSGEVTTAISSTFAGRATVTATISGATASLPLEFVATTPSKVVVQATPSALAPNLNGSTSQQASIVAKVTDAAGNPVKNIVVSFSKLSDTSGGDLSQPSAVTDSNGFATVKYTSGATSTASNGVEISASVASPSVVSSPNVFLTVNQSPLFIVLGTGNTISNLDEERYRKNWAIYVTDSTGAAVPNVTLTVRALPISYRKGRLTFFDPPGVWGLYDASYAGVQSETTNLPVGEWLECPNEDLNNNGVLDSGEDDNSSNFLEPGNVIAVAPGGASTGSTSTTIVTDAQGQGTVSLIYAESFHPWVKIALRATAQVQGSEAIREATFIVPGLSTDLNKEDTPPAGVESPFGIKASCGTIN